jgi:glutamate-1-semialdehyde 2,1-aminomutase
VATVPDIAMQRVGSIFWLVRLAAAQRGTPATPIRSLRALPATAAAGFAPLFHRLLREGIYLAPSAYEVGFLSAAHEESDIERLVEALRVAVSSS